MFSYSYFQKVSWVKKKKKDKHVPHICRYMQAFFFFFLVFCSVSESCLTLWPHGLYSPPGSSVLGIFLARIVDWVAVSYCRGSSLPRNWTHISHIYVYTCTHTHTHTPAHILAFSLSEVNENWPYGTGKSAQCSTVTSRGRKSKEDGGHIHVWWFTLRYSRN